MLFSQLNIHNFRQFNNKYFRLGKYLTIFSGRNSTGKSIILGMLANSAEIKKNIGSTYFGKIFRADFSELFKASKSFDLAGPNRFEIIITDDNNNEVDKRSFRTAWQKKKKNQSSQLQPALSLNLSPSSERFRVIPFKKLSDKKKTEAKFDLPVIYLGLSRLFPIGESKDQDIKNKSIVFKSDEHKRWFIDQYTYILSLHEQVNDIKNFYIGETEKKIGLGISTDKYDFLTNSSGQDNLGQILLALLSFISLKEANTNSWRGGLLLIDEIDVTLHPAAQLRLIDLLIKIAKEINIQIIASTHSISILDYLSPKIDHNSHDDNLNNNIELYYFTNANRSLQIKRNPPIHEVRSDLLIQPTVINDRKIKLYSEDDEARWFLKKVIPDIFNSYIDIVDSKIGCNQLLSLFNCDPHYFGNVLILFDGDFSKEDIERAIDPSLFKLNNIINLPGNLRPEQIIFEYLISLESDHLFWQGPSKDIGFTWDTIKDHGPTSPDFNSYHIEREKYKQWFNKNLKAIEYAKVLEFWKTDNQILVQDFLKELFFKYNIIAKRTLAIPIPNNAI